MSLLGTLGGLIGLSVAGPAGAAIGAGIGTLAGGGDAEDAIKAGILGFGIGSIPGVQNFASTAGAAMGLGGVGQTANLAQAAQGTQGANIAQALFGTGAGGATTSAVTGEAARAATGIGGGGGITGILNNPYVMAALLQQADKGARTDVLTDLQKRQIETGERMPGYKGRSIFEGQAKFVDSVTGQIYDSKAERDAAVQARQGFAMGGYVQGPGTGRSDSIPAQIYQDGKPVEQAALSDGEFVMTERAVAGAGNGNRSAGAAKMYELMKKFEKRAA